jgi:hypothetical protein
MVYINENKLNKGYINEYNKAYIGDKLLYWNADKYNEGEESLCYTYDLNNQWQESTLSLDGHMVFESFSNYNKPNSTSRMRINLNGCDTFNFKYYSDGEDNYDYVVIGKLDTDLSNLIYNTVTSTTYTQYTTKNKQKQWLDATFTIPNDGQEHFIDVVYRKDVSANKGADKGYIAFENKILNIRWVTSGTICNGETLYQKLVKEVTYDNIKWITTNEYKQGDMIEENSKECEWMTLTSDTPRDIPMQTFRIDITDPGTSSYYFITFSATPNYVGTNASITKFSICPDEGSLYDNGTKKQLSSLTKVEGNICEYTFSTIVYFAGGEQNAPLSQIQYKPM